MANIEYHSSVVYRSWQLPTIADQPYRKVEGGFWIRETIDRPIAAPRNGVNQFPFGRDEQVYQSLQEREIRLLILHPGAGCDPVESSIPVVTPDDPPDYDAVSYVWGNSSDRICVLVNGHQTTIGRNLSDVLHQLRSRTELIVLWIDAICINQERGRRLG
ncbi:hypothetical protein CLAFUW4_12635 [Fulvia fulva]|uniref:Heterokaryon incompatibility domain-containing protein n=1 Tax=Passalora fulva TaxID=5499 RepID=A0A9Q8USR6_PASFU|nr:uncharacterized protein CLAFUR5_11658 [Fulvia fulva]KAK4618898.1 hypothetical protein CLAFUR0_12651 [Fulvia fulva]UJO21071.1 hypothetical protein CLAFUR5_11658 [Fulvia fulva]WPV18010.1 hypothetical protein CLAFUW4_12635 [Fulvia fulva]WPV32959.1 hypothetical protein CLAFUW7_12642 [Fulvia fulva]